MRWIERFIRGKGIDISIRDEFRDLFFDVLNSEKHKIELCRLDFFGRNDMICAYIYEIAKFFDENAVVNMIEEVGI